MNSRSLYQFCLGKHNATVLFMLNHDKDIDILYREGAIVLSMIIDRNTELLKASIEYFENVQFPTKNQEYQKAREKFKEMLEEFCENEDAPDEMQRIVDDYIGIDIARVDDIGDINDYNTDHIIDNDMDDSESLSEEEKSDFRMIPVLPKSSNLEECIEAARNCNTEVIRQNLDMSNKSYKLMVISTAVQSNQDAIIDTLVDMVDGVTQKASILRMTGDKYAQADLFTKAEECYNKSLEFHPNYYVTHYKMGALYQRWAAEAPFPSDLEALKQKALANYTLTLEYESVEKKSYELEAKIELLKQQLKLLTDDVSTESEDFDSSNSSSDQRDSSDSENHNAYDELLSYLSEEEEDIVVSGAAAEITET